MELKESFVELKKFPKFNKSRLISLLVIFFCSSALGMSAAIFTNVLNVYNHNPNPGQKVSLNTMASLKNAVNEMQELIKPLDKKMNILIIGSDISYSSRGKALDDGPTRSDSLMLAQIDPQNKRVSLLSIPRDSRVMIPGYNYYDKINAAFAYGGEALARKTVTNLTGVTVDDFVMLKLNGLVNIVDILGGVEVYVDNEMHYTDHTAKLDINLSRGLQTLNGREAHHYIRFRHDNLGDIGRVQRQQKFIRAVTTKLLEPAAILKLPRLVQAVKDNVITNLSQTEMLRAAYFLKSLQKDQVKMVMLPGEFGFINRISYWVIDEKKSLNILSGLFPDSKLIQMKQDKQVAENSTEEKKKYRVTIRNGASDRNLSLKLANLYQENGWNVTTIDETKNPAPKTQVIVQTGQSKFAPELSGLLNFPAEIVNESVGDIYSDYTVLIGTDLADNLKRTNEIL